MIDHLDQDQFAKITNIFCAEIDKPSNPQRQVLDEDIFIEQIKDQTKKKNETEPIPQQRLAESYEEGKYLFRQTSFLHTKFVTR